ncbi:MAG TPA: amidohydrolase family protein [Cyclobacteriaceae bacterium]|nr:amidohydrolase family protein [Cyclobacteriaceae bacterium]
MKVFRFFAAIAFLIVAGHAFSQRTLIHCGSLIDGKHDAASQMTIVVEGNVITAVDKGFTSTKAGEKLIDLSRKTVMPGWIDLHVHLEGETSKDAAVRRYTMNEADIAFMSTVYAKKTLMAGFTSVRDLGGSGVNISLRNAINQGIVVGPRVFTAGRTIATTGGHGDPTNAARKGLLAEPTAAEGVINGPEGARHAVRQRYKDGSDLIKITATGGVLSIARDASGPQFTDEELKAIVETAKDYGMHVAVHAIGVEGAKRSVRAGVTTIEHGSLMNEELADLMKQHGTYHIATITAGESISDLAKIPGYYHPLVTPKALNIGPQDKAAFALAYKKGVKMAFGTDAGVFPHGENAREFGYMVEAGMPAMETIKTATMTSATILGMADKLGSIEPGKLADIVAVDDDPLKNIKTMTKCTFVMKDGVVYKSE